MFVTNLAQNHEIDQAIEVSEVMAKAMKMNGSKTMNDAFYQGEIISSEVEVLMNEENLNGESLNKLLKTHLKFNPKYNGTFIILETDEYTYRPYWYRTGETLSKEFVEDVDNPNYWTRVKEGENDLLEPVIFTQGDEKIILSTILVPIMDQGEVIGVAGLNFSMDYFKTMIKQVSDSEILDAYVIASNGIILSDTNNEFGGVSYEESDINPDWLGEAYKNKGLIESGDRYIMNIPVEISETGKLWSYLVTVPVDVLHRGNNDMQVIMTIALILGLIGLATFVSMTVRKNLKPIDDIMHVMESAKNGDLGQRTLIKSSDEIQIIGEGLNKLLGSLENNQSMLLKEIDDNEMLNMELEAVMQENDRIYFETIKSLNMAIEAKDHYTAGHCDRVTEYALAIADMIGLGNKEKTRLIYGATVHDIGKIGIPGTLLNKTDRLTDEEFDKIKSHPEKGKNILENIHFLEDSIPVVYQHHERYDGKGYPQGLKGDEIDLLARIVAIADTFDAMTSDRAYRKALSYEIAEQELLRNKGTQFDPELVDAFILALNQGIVVKEIENNEII